MVERGDNWVKRPWVRPAPEDPIPWPRSSRLALPRMPRGYDPNKPLPSNIAASILGSLQNTLRYVDTIDAYNNLPTPVPPVSNGTG